MDDQILVGLFPTVILAQGLHPGTLSQWLLSINDPLLFDIEGSERERLLSKSNRFLQCA